jgi:hypothetical protein
VIFDFGFRIGILIGLAGSSGSGRVTGGIVFPGNKNYGVFLILVAFASSMWH